MHLKPPLVEKDRQIGGIVAEVIAKINRKDWVNSINSWRRRAFKLEKLLWTKPILKTSILAHAMMLNGKKLSGRMN